MSFSSRLVCLGLLLTMCIPTLTFAKGKKLNAWRDCGIGAMIFTETKWAAVTSNILWDMGTTATTSSSSSKSQCAGVAATSARFIYQNYAVLEEETAIGTGDHLVTMLNILGCDASAHGKIIDSVRSNFSKSLDSDYAEKSHLEKAQTYHSNVLNSIKGSCAVI